MPFEADDVYVGMIAYFTVRQLGRHRRILSTNPTDCRKPRPFVCYLIAGEYTFWAHFTTTPKPWRRAVDRRWLRCPPGRGWQGANDLILGDGHNSWVGPPGAFAECSHKHDMFEGLWRPMLLPPGVEQVRAIVRSRGGLLPEPATPIVTARAA